MTQIHPPGDTSSLLVPVHLDAWVVDSQNQEILTWYLADYDKLRQLKSPLPEAFEGSRISKPLGIHLHWALPDALTHGRAQSGNGQIQFPYVPNRWLILRFNTPASGPWQCKQWVVHSDFLTSPVGITSTDLSGSSMTSISLQAPGTAIALPAATRLELLASDGQHSAIVMTAVGVGEGVLQIPIQSHDFTLPLPSGSSVRVSGTSAFLDPTQPSSMQVIPGSPTAFNVQSKRIGISYGIEAWETWGHSDNRQPFLRAVGPGNVSFAAYVPFVKNVFSFTDTDLPPEDKGISTFTYLVVGWYSDPQAADPLRGVATYDPDVWKTQQDWQSFSPTQRFQTLLTRLQWSVEGESNTSPPATSLYHGLVIDVQWPYSSIGNAGIDAKNVQVAVGNSTVDALAALIEAQARKEANENPTSANAWLAAGKTLGELMQAAMHNLLDDYAVPGGATLIRQQIEQARFGANPGGTIWNVVSAMQQTQEQPAASPALTPPQLAALNEQLAALNQAQRTLDEAQRHLSSLQADFYMMWLKVGKANSFGWGEEPTTVPPWNDLKPYMEQQIYPNLINQVWDQLCAVIQAQGKLPNPTDKSMTTQWANQHWTFPQPDPKLSGTLSLQDLGLALKASTMPRFWHPNDPVVLIAGLQRSQKHGADGRHNKDGTLTCRLPGQTITGLQISGQPTVNVPALQSRGVNLDPFGQHVTLPSISSLIYEAFFADPANATLIANAIGAPPQTISIAITNILEQMSGSASWAGTAPVPFAIRLWQQAWVPLFLEWVVNYYPTGSGTKSMRQFSLDDWQFDGEQYSWKGSGFDENSFVSYKGRALLTAQGPRLFKDKIDKYLTHNSNIDAQQLDTLFATVAEWDLLSQSFSGLFDQLITLLSQETFPPQGKRDPVQCPRPKAGGTPPSVATLVGDHYHAVPMLDAGRKDVNYFHPVCGGFLQFQRLQVVDAFGQSYPLAFKQGFEPLLSRDISPTNPSILPLGAMQLVPRLIQSTRLDFRFLANDSSGQDILVSNDSNAICGWLLPNHLDSAISVYDASGLMLGELLPLQQPDNWRPRPGLPAANLAPHQPDDIPNATLKAVVNSIAKQSHEVFMDVLKVIDETLWVVDPLGNRKDQFLSVLIGRPLAVVQVELQLSLLGDPAYNQMWNAMLPSQKPYSWLHNVGTVKDIAFPVRLGSLELRDDGLIGYFLPNGDDYATFYTLHYPDRMSVGNKYVRQIVRPPQNGLPSQYQGDIHLKCNGESVTVTLILDPRGSVHASSGILPVVSEALAPHLVEDFMKQLKVTFQTGPIIADLGAVKMPKPAESHGTWTWLQPIATPPGWEEDQILDADDRAHLPDEQLQLREGWLQLSDIAQAGT